MMTIKILNLGWETTLKRYFLMMFFVITGVFTQTWALAFLGLPVFLSAILGVRIEAKEGKAKSAAIARMNSVKTDSRKAS